MVDMEFEETYVLNQLSQSRLASNEPFRTADHVVAVREEACNVGGGVRNHIEDVPDVFDAGERHPLQSQTERRRILGNRDVEFADASALF